MNRAQFRAKIGFEDDNPATSFLAFFCHCLRTMSCEYVSLNIKIPVQHRNFEARGVEEAIIRFVWPGTINCPETATTVKVLEWNETSYELHKLRKGLANAIAAADGTEKWTDAILDWGMGPRGKAAQEFLKKQPNVAVYLDCARSVSGLGGDTSNVTADRVPVCNAGLAKVHALASPSGLIIYDSRVAFAVGECVNEWLYRERLNEIPEHLRFMQAGRRSTGKTSKLDFPRHSCRYRHPRESRDHRWLQTQMKCSWLFEAALEKEQSLWPDHSGLDRMHMLEAAFFMFGAYSSVLKFESVVAAAEPSC
jgi:hypothetical protein